MAICCPNQDPERVRVKLHGEKQPLSVRPTNLVSHGPIPTPELREAVLADVGSGEMPMRMSVRSSRSGMDPCHVDVPMFVHTCVLMCGRCVLQDNTDFMARVPPPYRRVVRLECVECVAFLVAEAGINANDNANDPGGISDFVEGRYMGSIETTSNFLLFIQGPKYQGGEIESLTPVVQFFELSSRNALALAWGWINNRDVGSPFHFLMVWV
ncbi:hypothetical protein Ae201684_005709 [Aphanomyces euteiches]|uniref:Uncharacterized protein n=1 Tax=Aphanomyces euteiches TaxID=100861 RepID=A0A6G0XE26_9STRA|nr:hypothetical protein Ae201684_005709 [Aphanomyces euteiches]